MSDLERLEAEMGEMDEVFGELGLDTDMVGLGGDLGELGAELEEAGLEELGLEEFGAEDFSLSSLAGDGDEGRADAAFLGSVVKRSVLRLLRLLINLLRRNPRLRRCADGVRYLTLAIRAARRGRWVTALRYARRAYAAFKRCIRRR